MPYKRTGRAPGRPLADKEKEAERQAQWEDKQKRKAERRAAADPDRLRKKFRRREPEDFTAEREAEKRYRRPDKTKAKKNLIVGFGAYAHAAKPHKPIKPILGMRAATEVKRRTLRAPGV